MRKGYLLAVVAFWALGGCTAGSVHILPGSQHVEVGSVAPADGYLMVGPISAKHGGGCGLYGSQGDFAGAMNTLRNQAAQMGATYVQIVSQRGEHMSGLCLDRAYVIDGLAYRPR
jgi:hypothetical protein